MIPCSDLLILLNEKFLCIELFVEPRSTRSVRFVVCLPADFKSSESLPSSTSSASNFSHCALEVSVLSKYKLSETKVSLFSVGIIGNSKTNTVINPVNMITGILCNRLLSNPVLKSTISPYLSNITYSISPFNPSRQCLTLLTINKHFPFGNATILDGAYDASPPKV